MSLTIGCNIEFPARFARTPEEIREVGFYCSGWMYRMSTPYPPSDVNSPAPLEREVDFWRGFLDGGTSIGMHRARCLEGKIEEIPSVDIKFAPHVLDEFVRWVICASGRIDGPDQQKLLAAAESGRIHVTRDLAQKIIIAIYDAGRAGDYRCVLPATWDIAMEAMHWVPLSGRKLQLRANERGPQEGPDGTWINPEPGSPARWQIEKTIKSDQSGVPQAAPAEVPGPWPSRRDQAALELAQLPQLVQICNFSEPF